MWQCDNVASLDFLQGKSSFAVRVALACCLSHIQGNHSHLRQRRSRIDRGYKCSVVKWVGGWPKCRLPASSQGLWQRAVFRSLPWTSAQNPSQLQGDQKTSIFTVQQHYARHEIVYSQWPRGFSISWWFVQRRGVGESGSWCWAWGQFAGNGSGCGKMPHHPFLCLFSNLLPVNHFPAHPVKIVTQFKACTVWAECKK